METITGKQLKALATIAASSKDHRPNIEVVWLDRNPQGKARLWATNGHHMVLKEFDIEGPELPRAYRVDDIKRLLPKDEIVIYELEAGYMSHQSLPEGYATAEDVGAPPDVDQIIPPTTETASLACNLFAVNPLLLAKGLKVVDTLAESTGVHFQLDDGELGPICISSDLGTVKYILMPIRTGSEKSVADIIKDGTRYVAAA